MHILIVEDEHNIRLTLTHFLEKHYTVTAVGSAEDALDLASKTEFDLVLLDINLPGMNGLEALEDLQRYQPSAATVVLTGHATVDNTIYAFQNGVIDFLEKPASHQSILTSVRKALRRVEQERKREALLVKARQMLEGGLQYLNDLGVNQGQGREQEFQVAPSTDDGRFLRRGSLLVDTYQRKATLKGEELELTGGEYDLLLCLVENAPRILGPQELVEETRGYECSLLEARDLIRWQVYLLRQKVEPDPSSPHYVINVRGQGYMWAVS
jgi:DNA-binding response OmpR family regulator